MNREQRRASHRNGLRQQKKPWSNFEDQTHRLRSGEIKWPGTTPPDRVFVNTKYIVQIFKNRKMLDKPCDKLMIRRCDSKPIYSWQDLQRIKNEIYDNKTIGFQMFPPESELIDDANLYWMWVVQ